MNRSTRARPLRWMAGLTVLLSLGVVSLQQASASQSDQQRRLQQALADQPQWIRNVYQSLDHAYFWAREGDDEATYSQLSQFIKLAGKAHALDENDYRLDEIAMKGSRPQREIAAATSMANLMQDLFEGRLEPSIELSDDLPSQRETSLERLLTLAYQDGDPIEFMSQNSPDNFLVEGLLKGLKQYRTYQQSSSWTTVNSPDGLIRVGDHHEVLPSIRQRLNEEGFYPERAEEMSSTLFGDADELALKRFQRSRSMMDDGIIGPSTIEALNEPLDALINRLLINIERARWLPSRLGSRSVLVNSADFRLRLYEGDRLVETMGVVVGEQQASMQTPQFAETMKRVVVNPYWNIPASIVINETAGKVIDDPDYLEKKDLEILSGWGENPTLLDSDEIDWEAVQQGEMDFRMRQRPGKDNALGRIKFLFPNRHAVYLHDTPAEELFEKDIRTFSHGCIRVERPIDFAGWVMKHQSDWDQDRIAEQIRSKERAVIGLDEEIPVYITYFTAWVDPDGAVSFARDVYDRDARLYRALSL